MITILDIDNCIADDAWRIPQIKWEETCMFKRYHSYHTLSRHDRVDNQHLFEGKDNIIVLTARPSFYRGQTECWLNCADIFPKMLLMREADDVCHSKELKQKQLRHAMAALGFSSEDVECAYDDRQDVVDMYKSMGVNAMVASIHNVCSYTPPKEK